MVPVLGCQPFCSCFGHITGCGHMREGGWVWPHSREWSHSGFVYRDVLENSSDRPDQAEIGKDDVI